MFDLKISENKNIKLEIDYNFKFEWFSFCIGTKTKHNNGGFFFELQFLSFYLLFSIYDKRNWNCKKDRWYLPNEEELENEISEKNLISIGFEKQTSLDLIIYRKLFMSFYNEVFTTTSIVLMVYKEPHSDKWLMTDNWTKVIGAIEDVQVINQWENFLKNKRLN